VSVISPLCLWFHHFACYVTTSPVMSPLWLLFHHCACGFITVPVITPLYLLFNHCACDFTTVSAISPLCLWFHHCTCYIITVPVYMLSNQIACFTHYALARSVPPVNSPVGRRNSQDNFKMCQPTLECKQSTAHTRSSLVKQDE
jgi:hypothetical protein